MFYEPDKGNHGLPRSPLKSCVVPRPIGWITTLADDGRVNLAPFSQFNLLSYDPAYVMFSASAHPPEDQRKDSIGFAERRGEFVYNMATYDLRHQVTLTSTIIDSTVDEMKAAKLTPAPCRLVRTPRVAESPINFECRHYTTLMLPGRMPRTSHYVVVGQVLGVHIDDRYIGKDGKVAIELIRPLARMGYTDYTYIDKVFAIFTPEEEAARGPSIGLDGGR